MSSEPFVRVWKHGGVSMIRPLDKRTWPWWCAFALAHADAVAEKGNCSRVSPSSAAWYRRRQLEWAERIAESHKSGYVNKKTLSMFMAWAVNTCDICGAKATYLMGSQGRCRKHLGVQTKAVLTARQRHDAANAGRALRERRESREVLAREHSRRFHIMRQP